MAIGRYEQHGQRYFAGRYAEFSIDEQGLDVEVDGPGTVGMTKEDLAWLLEPHVASYIPSHPAEPPAAETEAQQLQTLFDGLLEEVEALPMEQQDGSRLWEALQAAYKLGRGTHTPSKPAAETEALRSALLDLLRCFEEEVRAGDGVQEHHVEAYEHARRLLLTPSKVEPAAEPVESYPLGVANPDDYATALDIVKRCMVVDGEEGDEDPEELIAQALAGMRSLGYQRGLETAEPVEGRWVAEADVLEVGDAPNGQCEVILTCSRDQVRAWGELLYKRVRVLPPAPDGDSSEGS